MGPEWDADDEALYDVWRRLDEAQVATIHDVLDELAELLRERKRHGLRPTAEMIERARELHDGPLRLGFLPVVVELLANA